jgi:hypothetical protein
MITYKNEISWAAGVPGSSPSLIITPLRVALRNSQVLLNLPAEPEPVAKTLDKPHPAEVGKVAFVEGKTD